MHFPEYTGWKRDADFDEVVYVHEKDADTVITVTCYPSSITAIVEVADYGGYESDIRTKAILCLNSTLHLAHILRVAKTLDLHSEYKPESFLLPSIAA